ncbi:UNVERIFIED_CONTAM: hypothetical protein FKN15_051312 [Acipenser sinensis]
MLTKHVLRILPLGGANLGANGLWSNYSLKGRKGKKFENLPTSRSVIRACVRNHPKAKISASS